jgi:hypothetical protein
MRSALLLAIWFVTVAPTLSAGNVRAKVFTWPTVQPLSRSHYFPKSSTASIALTVHSPKGSPLYRFECNPRYGGPEGTIEAFECRLNPVLSAHDSEATLFGEDPFDQLAAHSRGLVWASQLVGSCAGYPGWGTVRYFRLRGMKLTLAFKRIEYVRKSKTSERIGGSHKEETVTLRSFGVDFKVEPYRGALSAIAEPVPYEPPSAACGAAVSVHIPGIVDKTYIRINHLGPPYQSVKNEKKTVTIKGVAVPTDFQFAVRPISPKARVVNLPIPGTDGMPAYRLECSAYNVPIGQGKIDRYGIVCGLFAMGGKTNLLLDAVGLYSRMSPAEILPGQLFGPCASYPGWGSTREFKLRGMDLRLSFSKPVFTAGDFAAHALRSVNLTMTVDPDPSALSPVAGPPKYLYWGLSNSPSPCETILVGPPDDKSYFPASGVSRERKYP